MRLNFFDRAAIRYGFVFLLTLAFAACASSSSRPDGAHRDVASSQRHQRADNVLEYLAYWNSEAIEPRSSLLGRLTASTPLQRAGGGGYSWANLEDFNQFQKIGSLVSQDLCAAVRLGENFLNRHPKMVDGSVSLATTRRDEVMADYSLRGIPFLGLSFRAKHEVVCFLPSAPELLDIFNVRNKQQARDCHERCPASRP